MDFPNSSLYTPPLESDIEASQAALEHLRKRASLASYNVRVFDMSLRKDVDEYTSLMKEVLEGLQAKTHYVWAKERTLVDGVWKIYLEWSVYTINKEASETGKVESKENLSEDTAHE